MGAGRRNDKTRLITIQKGLIPPSQKKQRFKKFPFQFQRVSIELYNTYEASVQPVLVSRYSLDLCLLLVVEENGSAQVRSEVGYRTFVPAIFATFVFGKHNIV